MNKLKNLLFPMVLISGASRAEGADCQYFHQLRASFPTNFATIKGKEDDEAGNPFPDRHTFASIMTLPGSHSCFVGDNHGRWSFECSWLLDRTDIEARQFYDSFVDSARTCLHNPPSRVIKMSYGEETEFTIKSEGRWFISYDRDKWWWKIELTADIDKDAGK